LKKTLLKTSKIVLMYSDSLARHFSSMFHAKCLLPRLDRLLPVRSCLQNFYQCISYTAATAAVVADHGDRITLGLPRNEGVKKFYGASSSGPDNDALLARGKGNGNYWSKSE
jgi:hypothetical protein